MEQGYIYLNNDIFPTLFASSQEEQERGLMYMEPPTPVMSFIYERPQINRFWMKATKAPLDIVFCCNGKVIEICYGEPHSTKIIGTKISDLVIELPYGTTNSIGLKLGDNAGLVKSSSKEIYKNVTTKRG